MPVGRMLPLHLSILLHYSAHPVPYAVNDVPHAVSEVTLEYTEQLVNRGLIAYSPPLNHRSWPHPAMKVYRTTGKGQQYIYRILSYASDGAPPRTASPSEKQDSLLLRNSYTFLQFFGSVRLPGWLWLVAAFVFVWR